ncbi:hypothetical protein [Frankia sp. AgB32]|uniref:hypothetical protein n=1 Tax=Frankia sp. AgB32 TaxID=631119 RepID=UPI00200FCAFA|nr:hypothetical protein [Frankia sp. AgB32]MCK9893130.1 hypothetical protein [Frankia sp. AgB32]
MSFKAWMTRLRADGHLVCPASSAVPVDVRSVRRDGVGLHFRCRGTAVRLAAYRPGRTAWQVCVRDEAWCPEEELQLWAHRPLESSPPPTGARLAFPGAQPDQVIVIDGAKAYGWTSHEAGLLRPADAAALFDRLAADLAIGDATTPVRPTAQAQGERPALHLGRSPEITVPVARSVDQHPLVVPT